MLPHFGQIDFGTRVSSTLADPDVCRD